ncbi:DNA topoisomerase IB [Variovorax sp. GT1P44]|uniref:DNA topoisomerase IB n=1 Tax=Variovorax sp. GT1P44 TaxID=3443742 RepID=UPI003F490143
MPEPNHRPPPLANGLVYVDASMPGWRRVKRGTAFGYRDTDGQWLRDADEISRIRRLAIPPAYRDVWICPLANGHLQATGVDARGRKQYRYHAEWRSLKDETKFDRLEAFGRALPRIRSRVARDLRAGPRAPLDRKVVLATLVRLLDTTFLRVGNEEYASSNGSYGLTTLRNKHADVRGASLKLRFRGKSGVMHETEINDPRVSKIVRRCQQLPGQELFQYQDEDGSVRGITSTDVNAYLREVAGENFTAKDFRTWHGTAQALELTHLACGRDADKEQSAQRFSAKEVLEAVAARLGNTPAVCKKAYVHPAVLALGATLADDPGIMTEIWAKIANRMRSTRDLRVSEARLIAFLVQHRFGDKRRSRVN